MYLAGLDVGLAWKEFKESAEKSQRPSHKVVAELFTWSDDSVYKKEIQEAPAADDAVLAQTREQLLQSLRKQSAADPGKAPE